jgi:hypothetical protein
MGWTANYSEVRLAGESVGFGLYIIMASALLGCHQTDLLVQVSGIPSAAASLVNVAVLNKLEAFERPMVPLPPSIGSYDYVLELPQTAMGRVQLAIGAADSAGCLLAIGNGEFHLGPESAGQAFQLPVPLVSRHGSGANCGSGPVMIDSVSPGRVDTVLGGTVTVEGFGFSPYVIASVDGLSAGITWNSPTELTLAVPPSITGGGYALLSLPIPGGGQLQLRDVLAYALTQPGFAEQDSASGTQALWQPVLADLDNDGLPDLAAVDHPLSESTPFAVSIYLNQGRGSFGAPTAYPLSGTFASLASADFDGDGRIDLAVASWPPGPPSQTQVTILHNQGKGVLAATTPIAVTGLADGLIFSATDLDGDNQPDLGLGSGNRMLAVLLNQGHGAFSGVPDYSYPSTASCFAALDVDNDNQTDLVVVSDSGVDVLRNQGQGRYPPRPTHYPVAIVPADPGLPTGAPSGCGPATPVDADGDGLLDLIVPFSQLTQSGQALEQVAVLLNQGHGGFQASAVAYSIDPALGIGIGDLNRDGLPDVYQVGPGNFYLMLNQGRGLLEKPGLYPRMHTTPTYGTAAADLDRGGLADVVVLGPGSIEAYLNQFR